MECPLDIHAGVSQFHQSEIIIESTHDLSSSINHNTQYT